MSLQQAASGAVCPLQACQRWTGWAEGNLPSRHGRSICICICICLYLLDMITISIHSLVLPSFDFHLNINVFKAKIQSWKRLNKFWCSGQHRANQRRLQRQLCLQVNDHEPISFKLLAIISQSQVLLFQPITSGGRRTRRFSALPLEVSPSNPAQLFKSSNLNSE